MILDYNNGIRGRITRAIWHYLEANDKYMFNYNEKRKHSLSCGYGWALQPFPYGGFEYTKDISMFTPDFIVNYDKNSDLGYTLIADIETIKNTYNYYRKKTYHFYLKK